MTAAKVRNRVVVFDKPLVLQNGLQFLLYCYLTGRTSLVCAFLVIWAMKFLALALFYFHIFLLICLITGLVHVYIYIFFFLFVSAL